MHVNLLFLRQVIQQEILREVFAEVLRGRCTECRFQEQGMELSIQNERMLLH